ncbi:MAG: OB-fold nucleic acid binding domain-containing protein, partial [Peptococcales bacterium]
IDEKTANRIFDQMIDFASYAFNKSHAAAYAVIAYQTAWLKYYYPVEFMAALLNSFLDSTGKISHYVRECKHMGIEVLPPDINESDVKFTVINGKIRFGMAAVKNVGEAAVGEIIRERGEKGPFKSFGDFCERMGGKDINKRCVESLIKCGAFDSFRVYRSKMMAVYEKLLDGAQQSKRSKMEGQLSLFETHGEAKNMEIEESYPELKEFPQKMMLAMEKEMLGLYVTGHPLQEYEDEIREQVSINSSELAEIGAEAADERVDGEMAPAGRMLQDGMLVTVGGIITGKKTKTTRSNNLMAFVTLEDMYGSMEVIVFPAVLNKYGALLAEESPVFIDGRISVKEDEQPKIICETVRPIKKMENYVNSREKLAVGGETGGKEAQNPGFTGDLGENGQFQGRLCIRTTEPPDSKKMKAAVSLLKYFSGNMPVFFYKTDDMGNISKMQMGEYRIKLCDTLHREIIERFGEENVKIVSKRG